MSATLMVALLCLGQTASPGESTSVSEEPSGATAKAERSARQLQAAVLAAMKRSSPISPDDPAEHVLELIDLYIELGGDAQLAVLERERLRSMVRNRLEWLADKLSKRKPKKEVAKSKAPGPAQIESIEKPKSEQEVLAQLGGPGAGGNQGGAGGFGGGFGLGGNPGQRPDYGPQLVDLIKKTIAPETWDDRGGPGSIYYYRPLRVLVIRQTSEVHHSLGGLIGGLRANGP